MRLVRRLAVVRRSVRVVGDAQFGLIARAGRKAAPRRAMGRLFGAATLRNPAMQLIAVEKIVAPIDKRGRGTILKAQEYDRVAFRGPRAVKHSGVGPHASN